MVGGKGEVRGDKEREKELRVGGYGRRWGVSGRRWGGGLQERNGS